MSRAEARARVLVVDDDPAIRDCLRMICEDEGHSVVVAATAAEALDAAAAGPFTAVLLDVNLPDEDGFTVLESLRAMEAHAATAVILLTGSLVDGWEERALALGATDFVTKPIRLEELARRLALVTRMRRSLDAAVERANRRAASVAHDFGNLLTVLSGYVDLALSTDSAADAAMRTEELHELRRNIERGDALMRQLIEPTAEPGRTEPPPSSRAPGRSRS